MKEYVCRFFSQKVHDSTYKVSAINGAVALVLPKSTTTVKIIKMTDWERKTFEDELEVKVQAIVGSSEMLTRIAEMKWYAPLIRPITCADSSKVEMLKKDLQDLLSLEPNMRAVVYSHFIEQQRFAHEAAKSLGLKTHVVNGSKTADQRDKAIRKFQSLAASGPAVFLVTLKAGSAGVTLHAASHVFLLEPCIDPGTEVQAAGRIHRLGQTKQVGVTKYVFDDSCESNILKLHEKIHNGELEYTSGILSRDALEMLFVRRSYRRTIDGDYKRIEYTDLAREHSSFRFYYQLGLFMDEDDGDY